MKASRLTFNGVDFEYLGTTHSQVTSCHTLWDCYDKPSHTKEQIWLYWLEWFNSMDNSKITVSGYNSNFFTIEGDFEVDDIKYHAIITASHNRLYEIV